ncbi:MAG: FeoA family protein [Nitrosomonadales bacterium]
MKDKLIPLSELSENKKAVVKKLNHDQQFNNRLNSLGMSINKTVTIIRKMGLNGPLHIQINTTEFMLRKIDAEKIEVIVE